MLKHRLKRIENQVNQKSPGKPQAWNVPSGPPEKREQVIKDILAGKIKNPLSGCLYSEHDANYMLDFSKFLPDCFPHKEDKEKRV